VARDLRYLRLAVELRELLTSGKYEHGQLLPSESDLASSFAVSRVTVRKALGRLKDEGVVDSRQGFGWFAMVVPLRQSLQTLMTIEAQIAAAGRRPRRRLLGFAFVQAPQRVQAVLGAQTVLEVSRLNLADDEPLVRNTAWVPEDLAADISRRDIEQHSLHDLLALKIAGATQVITAVTASGLDAELLGVPVGSPILFSRRTTHNTDARAVLYSEAAYHPLRSEFVIDLQAAHHQSTGLRLVADD
jgi:GntR family transcriptional regulator